MIQIITFFLLFIIPFIIAPFGVTQFENPKVIAAEFGIILLLLASIFSNKFSVPINKIIIVYGLIVVLTAMHLTFFRSGMSLFGNAFRGQGIFLLWMLLTFSYLSSNISLNKLKWWIFAGLLWIESTVMFFLPLNESQRFVGTVGEPNALAIFAIFTWPFGWNALKNKSKNLLFKRILILTPVVVILFFSGSKSAMIAFAIQLLFIFLINKKFSFKKAAFICLFTLTISYFFPYFQKNPYENRVEVWRSAVAAGKFSPVVGNGFGNMDTILHKAAEKVDLPIQYYYFDSSHNIFLDWWVQGGVIGLLLISALVYLTLKKFIDFKITREFVLFLGVLTCLSFNPTSVGGLLAFWWLIGQSSGKP